MGSSHHNSWASYEKCVADNKFARLIYRIARYYQTRSGQSFTDREIKDLMYAEEQLPYNDMNMVRPKITKLIKEGFLLEVSEVHDKDTNRKVRKVRWNPNAGAPSMAVQRDLFAAGTNYGRRD